MNQDKKEWLEEKEEPKKESTFVLIIKTIFYLGGAGYILYLTFT